MRKACIFDALRKFAWVYHNHFLSHCKEFNRYHDSLNRRE